MPVRAKCIQNTIINLHEVRVKSFCRSTHFKLIASKCSCILFSHLSLFFFQIIIIKKLVYFVAKYPLETLLQTNQSGKIYFDAVVLDYVTIINYYYVHIFDTNTNWITYWDVHIANFLFNKKNQFNAKHTKWVTVEKVERFSQFSTFLFFRQLRSLTITCKSSDFVFDGKHSRIKSVHIFHWNLFDLAWTAKSFKL